MNMKEEGFCPPEKVSDVCKIENRNCTLLGVTSSVIFLDTFVWIECSLMGKKFLRNIFLWSFIFIQCMRRLFPRSFFANIVILLKSLSFSGYFVTYLRYIFLFFIVTDKA